MKIPLPLLVPVTVAAIAGAAVAPAPALAQASRAPICWLRPGPLAQCNTWLVTEAAVEVPITTTRFQVSAGGDMERDYQTRFVLSLGLMKNVSSDRAAGIVVGHDVNRDILRGPTRAEARVRQWRGTSAVDLSAGVTRKGIQGAGDTFGFTGAVGAEWKYVGADARVDVHQAAGRRVVGGFLGARAGSVAAPVAALAVFGAVAVLIATTGAGY